MQILLTHPLNDIKHSGTTSDFAPPLAEEIHGPHGNVLC